MKWNIGASASSSSSSSSSGPVLIDPSLPTNHPAIATSSINPPAECPMHRSTAPPPPPPPASVSGGGLAKCPIDHNNLDPSMNPLNNIPASLSLNRQPGQQLDLPTERTRSTIPRPSGENPGGEAYGTGSTWDYPSPQQFYNALVRKGWETPEDSVEVMVDIHNFINEQAWYEVMKWEKRLPGGENAQLARFTGRPGELSPKARMHLWLGKFFPNSFNTEPPFDRHDWIVTRPLPTSTTVPKEEASTRYVIDYYSAPPDEDGNPVFSLDVRPALDSLESVSERIKVSWEEWRNNNANGDGNGNGQ
ncbi:cytochrome c heme-lyase [Kwoniella mangroviensis CBS 8886]|nr:cytochrome c heme-lyase [Kwoniella mangroviensis CBS 8886]